jgi:putative aldouronate transport system substrate-binding protein
MKKISLIALTALAALGLASCGGQGGEQAVAKNGKLNIFLNYNGQNGVSYIKTEPFNNTVDGMTYTQGALLPTWRAFAENLQVDIVDVAEYSTSKDNDTYDAVVAKNFVGANGAAIDLFYNSVTNIKKMASAGTAVDLMDYLVAGDMPHFARYLSENPEVLDMCAIYDKDGNPHIYYTPYFDGYQQIERMFIMDTEMVERLLDVEGAGDTTAALGEGRLAGNYYKPYMDAAFNYKDKVTHVSSVNDKDEVITVEVQQTANIILQQNAALKLNANTTGKELVAQFQAYLKAAYPTYSGKLSEIFTGVKAVYNPDDLVALLRVVKANPATATGVSECKEVTTLFPRGEAANRMENMYDFAAIWGLNGVDSESNNLFFDGAGKLNVLGGMQASYDALVLLNQLYNEGLIQKNFHELGTKKGTYYLDQYFKNTSANSGAGFMLYDYCASTTVGNKVDANGVGTKTEQRQGVYAGKDRTGIRPVLAPVTYWNTSYAATNTDKLVDALGQAVDRDKKTLTRFSDSNRALKSNSWCIPTNAQNKAAAVKLMDYLYSAEGSNINDFGPAAYQGDYSNDIIYGEWVPTLGAPLIAMYLQSGTDFWSFMRENIGSTNGIGSIRSDALDMQVTNQYAQVGLKNVQKAVKLGIMTLANCKTAENYGWNASVPTNWQVSENSDAKNSYKKVNDFWNASSTGAVGWKAVVIAPANAKLEDVTVNEGVKLSDVIAEMDTFNKNYLSVWANSINCTPDWLVKLQQGK